MTDTDNKSPPTKTQGHTPGPWYAMQGMNQMVSDDTTVASLRDHLYIFSETAKTHGDAKADARLIAAAPELLEALRDLLPYAENEAYSLDALKDSKEAIVEADRADNAIERAHYVITKAVGQ